MKQIIPWILRVLIGVAIAFLVAGAVMLVRRK